MVYYQLAYDQVREHLSCASYDCSKQAEHRDRSALQTLRGTSTLERISPGIHTNGTANGRVERPVPGLSGKRSAEASSFRERPSDKPTSTRRAICGDPRPLKQRYDWETDMTLCIGALAQDAGKPRIVLCFDNKVWAEEIPI